MESGWNDFQRKCLEHVSRFLKSVKKLVEEMGDDVLTLYIRYGCLPDEVLDKTRTAKVACDEIVE